jgi:uncharacterized membrane protein
MNFWKYFLALFGLPFVLWGAGSVEGGFLALFFIALVVWAVFNVLDMRKEIDKESKKGGGL